VRTIALRNIDFLVLGWVAVLLFSIAWLAQLWLSSLIFHAGHRFLAAAWWVVALVPSLLLWRRCMRNRSSSAWLALWPIVIPALVMVAPMPELPREQWVGAESMIPTAPYLWIMLAVLSSFPLMAIGGIILARLCRTPQ
jgi:hypothetical protein